MCGVAGWLASNGSRHGDEVARMLSQIEHRGPDGEGIFSADGLTLGHRRLAIIDLSSDGAQPMVRGHATISFNGEIYNYVELRKELEKLGQTFKTDSDTEVLLAAYLQWGTRAVERFDGMWAFAIYDAIQNSVFLSRDRFGEKPLLYSQSPGNFVFASEARQLRAVGFGRDPDELALREMISFGSKVSPEITFYEGISNFPAATNLVIDLADLSMHWETYHRAGASGLFDGIEASHVPSILAEEFERSVTARLRSDVQIGMLLSGGIDSSLIATVAGPKYLEATGRPLIALTASSGDSANDESRWSQSVAADTGVEWVCVPVSPDSAKHKWAEATRAIGQPLGSSSIVMQLEVMRQARLAGCTVLLDGQGADESWLGYPRYVVSALRDMPVANRLKFMRESVDQTGLGWGRWLAYCAYFSAPSVAAMRGRKRLRSARIELDSRWYKETFSKFVATGGKSVKEVQQSQLQGEQLAALLGIADHTSMSFSLEDRMPFLDNRIVELAMALPTDVLFHSGWSKWPLRRQLALSVAPEVAWRKRKVGFEPATDSFAPNSKAVQELTANSQCLEALGSKHWDLRKADDAIRWRLFAIALWEAQCLA